MRSFRSTLLNPAFWLSVLIAAAGPVECVAASKLAVAVRQTRNLSDDPAWDWLGAALTLYVDWYVEPVMRAENEPLDKAADWELDAEYRLKGDKVILNLTAQGRSGKTSSATLEGDYRQAAVWLHGVRRFLAEVMAPEQAEYLRGDPPTSDTTALRLVIKAEESGQWHDKAEAYRAALVEDGSFDEARRRLGIALYMLADYNGARDQFGAYLRNHPREAAALNNLGMTLLKLGLVEEALAALREAVAGNSRYAEGRFNLARALTSVGRLDEADREYRALISALPAQANQALLEMAYLRERQGDHPGALEAVNRVAGEETSGAAEYFYNMGLRAWEEADFTGAKAGFRLALALAPKDYLARLALGIVRYEEGDYENAVAELSEAKAARDNDPELYRYRGLAFQKMGRERQAAEDFRKSLDLLASLPAPREWGHASVAVKTGASSASSDSDVQSMRRALDDSLRENASLQAKLAELTSRLDEATAAGRAAGTESPFQGEAIRRENIAPAQESEETDKKTLNDALYTAALWHHQRGQDEKARDILTELVARNPGHGEGYLLLGGVFLDLGDYVKATEAFEKSREAFQKASGRRP